VWVGEGRTRGLASFSHLAKLKSALKEIPELKESYHGVRRSQKLISVNKGTEVALPQKSSPDHSTISFRRAVWREER
jgi:hypothetical protein